MGPWLSRSSKDFGHFIATESTSPIQPVHTKIVHGRMLACNRSNDNSLGGVQGSATVQVLILCHKNPCIQVEVVGFALRH